MSKHDKALKRLLSRPKDYTYSEAKTFVGRLGYKEITKGKTSGSRIMFYRESDGKSVLLHKPHPSDIMKRYSIEDLIERLIFNGDISDEMSGAIK